MKKNLITTCLLLLFASQIATAQKNLITNGGFEDDFFGWNNNGAKLTPWDLKAGKASCAIVTPNADNWVGIDQTARVPKKAQSIEFSAWTKAINIVKGKEEWNGGVFTVEFLDVQDKKIGDGVNIARITGDSGWTLFKKVIKVPPGAVNFRVLLAMGYASGTMIIDDVFAKAVSTEEVAKSK